MIQLSDKYIVESRAHPVTICLAYSFEAIANVWIDCIFVFPASGIVNENEIMYREAFNAEGCSEEEWIRVCMTFLALHGIS